jgi:predicted DNA binding CopG/RHH family protein
MINEKELIQEIENDEWQPIKDITKEKEKLQNAVREKYKKKVISIRLSEADIRKLKKKSLETGIPYQTLISSLIHQYVEGKIKIEL